jgi:hypothetical protein
MSRSFCPKCFRKQREIDRLEEEVQRLRGKLRHQERRAKEGLFGASTPSSKVPLRENAGPEARRRRGGGRPGHAGHGRRGATEYDADGEIEFPARAAQVKEQIVAAIRAPARHLGVRAVQDLFRANAHRLYH